MIAYLALAALVAAPYQGSIAEKNARTKGRKVVKELALDIDGDGVVEAGIVEQLADGRLRVAVMKPTKKPDDESGGWRLIGETQSKPAQQVLRLEAKQVAGRVAPELVAVLEDPSPDETALHVKILMNSSRGVREIFAQTFFVAHEGQPVDPNVVSYGDATPHFLLTDIDEEEGSDLEIVWIKEAQKIAVETDKGPVTFVIGAYRTIYRYDRDKEEFTAAAENEVVDFLEAKPISEVSASAQVPKVWGTAQAFWGADGDLATAWSIEAPKGAAGQSLTVKFKGPTEVSMIRVVPGCGDDAAGWAAHFTMKTFRLVLSSGMKVDVDRTKLGQAGPGVRAVGEFPLDEGFGAQDLVFLAEKQVLKWAKLEVVELEPNTTPKPQLVNEACVSEMSFH